MQEVKKRIILYYNNAVMTERDYAEALKAELTQKFSRRHLYSTTQDIIYDATDGCRNKYRCANAIWILSVLGFTDRVVIYRCTISSGHGRRKIDDINGYYKS